MPKGKKLVIWNPENDKKLFLAILASQDVKVDYAFVAAVFGKTTMLASLDAADLPLKEPTSHLHVSTTAW